MFLYAESRAMTIKKYTTLICLILSFFIPIMLSMFLYYYHEHFNLKTKNHGVLINPPMDVKNLWQTDASKKWQIVHVSKDKCDADCENIDQTLSQIKTALGKYSERVNVKEVSLSGSKVDESKQGFSIENKVYLVDPTGNVFMYYTDTSNPMNILKDLKHVLEVSQVG